MRPTERIWSAPLGHWRGQSAFVVGGGPSIRDFDWARLRGRNVIAVNAAYVEVPDAEFHFFSDKKFYEWNHERPDWSAYRGTRITTTRGLPGTHGIYNTTKVALSLSPNTLSGYDSGTKSLNLAFLLGADPIYLLGFDMKPNGYYHDRHKEGGRQGRYYTHFIPSIEAMAAALKARGVEVVNACPDSGIDCFVKIGLDQLPI